MDTNYEQEDDQRDIAPDRGRMGGIEGKSSRAGIEQDEAFEANSQQLFASKEEFDSSREGGLGKILGQLREMQEAHLAYVEGHEQRLRARLQAAQDHHNQILQQMGDLEQQILVLLDSEKTE